MTDQPDPDDQSPPSGLDLTAMVAAAAALKDAFDGFVAAGFDAGQAIYLVGQILTAQIRSSASLS